MDNADRTCKVCTGCATCSGSGASACTSCPEGKYLKDTGCVDNTCGGGNTYYPDPVSRKCIPCGAAANEGGIEGCATCEYDSTKGKPKCLTCTDASTKIPKTSVDGTSICILKASCADGKTHFLSDTQDKCAWCGDNTQEGVANCGTCSAKNTCDIDGCLPGFFRASATSCTACGANCATCSEANNANKCLTCMAGFFLKGTAGEGQCVACGDNTQGGIDGCAECDSQSSTLKCTKCKPNRKSKGESGNYTCEEKTCEDDSACGGTAGSCGAIVVDGDGNMKYYCSLCGKAGEAPINGLCTSNTNGNQCSNGACQSCAANYFLYMGGCYSVSKEPGSLMCKTAEGGMCTTAANNRYFLVPGAKATDQSVLRCGSSSGTTTGTGSDAKAYVGVEGCKTCTAPSEASSAGMAAAKCTACNEGKALTGSGYGCVTCDIAGCSACKADNACEACSDGYRLEGEACVRTGGNLSTGTIAGISVTKSSPAPCC
ncbi:Variant-specific surface protein [Giardia duodenalis]|uniref:Variant-specific surface protein n=1 Tax=Giardia intestinalis TaxID=5741 RepID=V6TVB9_GIAIN|nr:Variant-specific surface protein [Giardia intestinalis]